ncbi:MAG TPA: hypothetical protein VFV99_10210 [Kofleriaceae bacterium]|nr:hypothetical protein [Kofleriaceae bacterium]
MFQLAHRNQRQRDVDVSHKKAIEPASSTVGKRSLTQEMSFGAPDRYTRAIESARRELRAVRTVALPQYLRTLRDNGLEAIAKQTQLATLAMQVRHLLMTANQHVKALEKAAVYRDPMVLFLRHDLDTLAGRAAKLGVYRGAENMMPKAHVEEEKKPQSRGDNAQLARKSTKTRHALRVNLQAPVERKRKPAPVPQHAPTRAMRGSSTSVRALQRKAHG